MVQIIFRMNQNTERTVKARQSKRVSENAEVHHDDHQPRNAGSSSSIDPHAPTHAFDRPSNTLYSAVSNTPSAVTPQSSVNIRTDEAEEERHTSLGNFTTGARKVPSPSRG